MKIPQTIDVAQAMGALTFLPDRTPGREITDWSWAATLNKYRDGGIYVVHWAGESDWERHVADELFMVLDGLTIMTLLIDDKEVERTLGPMQMIVVPKQTWHRFVTPDEVKVLAISPQPTEHRVDHPGG